MAVSRAAVVDERLRQFIADRPAQAARGSLDQPVVPGSRLTARMAVRLFEAQVESRMLDLAARDFKARGHGYYTIGSSGHEGNAAVAATLHDGDMAFLHYRSGAFFCARANGAAGEAGPYDVALGLFAAHDEPIAGGRHKVFGSVALNIPPQTSTIASHLPKALGYAIAIDRKARLLGQRDSRIAVCTFGDASANHATATSAFHAAGWTAYQNVPAPVLFVCEDNGIGISVRTPDGWIGAAYQHRAGMRYFHGDGLSLPSVWDAAAQAADYVRRQRKPAFLHLRTVRMLGHAGSDVEQLYRSQTEIEDAEAQDPLLRSAALLIDNGWLTPDQTLGIVHETRARIYAMADEACQRPTLTTAAQVVRPLATHTMDGLATALKVAPPDAREAHFGALPEAIDRPRHLAMQINRALHDILLAHGQAILFGEDVARKGGVYHVTADLNRQFGVGRVFNTLLDETSILGLAIGAGHAGLLPMPEIQYLAYLMNAIDQLRGEAGSMQFFSNGQYSNPMVLRIAALGYQKGFGGHFHNDNGIAALREIPGVLIGCPSRGDDAARMLRTLTASALAHGRVTVMLEPIALYMTKDLHATNDGLWSTNYPPPDQLMPLDEVGVTGDGDDLCIISFANGLWMSRRVAARLQAELGVGVRVVDLRWLHPLPMDAIVTQAKRARAVLIVDECRASSGVADAIVAGLVRAGLGAKPIQTVTGMDTYIPLGPAANLVLVQEPDIDAAARRALAAEVPHD